MSSQGNAAGMEQLPANWQADWAAIDQYLKNKQDRKIDPTVAKQRLVINEQTGQLECRKLGFWEGIRALFSKKHPARLERITSFLATNQLLHPDFKREVLDPYKRKLGQGLNAFNQQYEPLSVKMDRIDVLFLVQKHEQAMNYINTLTDFEKRVFKHDLGSCIYGAAVLEEGENWAMSLKLLKFYLTFSNEDDQWAYVNFFNKAVEHRNEPGVQQVLQEIPVEFFQQCIKKFELQNDVNVLNKIAKLVDKDTMQKNLTP